MSGFSAIPNMQRPLRRDYAEERDQHRRPSLSTVQS